MWKVKTSHRPTLSVWKGKSTFCISTGQASISLMDETELIASPFNLFYKK